MLNLVKVNAFYKDAGGQVVPANPLNALMAEDAAPRWEAWRNEATARGWELLLSPPAAGDYTRAMFRTPDDAVWIAANSTTTAATVDAGTHQAGRAVDLDLAGMAAYAGYSYADLVAMAERHGFTNRVYKLNGSEPWHFDDNPVNTGLFSSMKAAVEAIGNTAAQVAAAVAAGFDTPQVAAVKAALTSPAGLGLLILAAVGLGAWAWSRGRK